MILCKNERLKGKYMKKDIIVYDFDKTIYSGESGTNFFTYYAKKYPLKAFLFALGYLKEVLFYLIKIINLKCLKERFYVFLESHTKEEIEEIIDGFWKEYGKRIYPWVGAELKENRKETDIVIVSSATPLFLIDRFIKELGYDMAFGTEFEGDGKERFISVIKGENNKGEEKVKKLDKWAKENNMEYRIIKFYSDSLADKPLFDIAEVKYWIKRGKKLEGMPVRKTILDKFFWD